VLLATLLIASDGIKVMPLVIVAAVVAYVANARIAPGELSPAGGGARHGWPRERGARGVSAEQHPPAGAGRQGDQQT